QAARGKQIFHGDGDSVKRPAVTPRGQFVVGPARLVERLLGRDGEERVEFRIEVLDAADRGKGQFHRGDTPGAQGFGGFANGHGSSSARNSTAGSSAAFSCFARGRNDSSSASSGPAIRSRSRLATSMP